MILHCFNPSHDEALANGSATYHPSKAARGLAADLSALPLWYGGADACVRLDATAGLRRWYARYAPLMGGARAVFPPEPLPPLAGVAPWGWDAALCERLRRDGVAAQCLPDAAALAAVRRLSSRREAVDVLALLRGEAARDGWDGALCGRSHWCDTEEAARRFVERYPRTVLKAPWSGSGRGLRRAVRAWTPALSGWFRRVAAQQGGVVVEPWYEGVFDCAMEFETDGRGGVRYCGLSLFDTRTGIYCGNVLAPQPRLEAAVASGLPRDTLPRVRQALAALLSVRVAPFYAGPLGIDMMVCRAGGLRLHPCVEINLRRTMGHVALALARRLPPDAEGRFALDFDADSRLLAARVGQRVAAEPFDVSGEGQLTAGTLPLTPVGGQTHFHASLSVSPGALVAFVAAKNGGGPALCDEKNVSL